MNIQSARVRKDELYTSEGYSSEYIDNPIGHEDSLIDGNFKKESSIRAAAVSKINRTLRNLLLFLVIASFAGYYFSMITEYNLNNLSRQISTLNDENAELENDLNKLKSLNNVDTQVTQSNFLHKAGQVMQVNAVGITAPIDDNKKIKISSNFNWTLGY